mgnify:CR=1 FL=1
MRTITPKKLIGSLVVASALTLGIFGTAKASQAFFLGTNKQLIFDATVGSVGTNSVTVYTTSSSPITLQINNRTRFSNRGSLGSLSPGDQIKVFARRSGGQLVATLINRPANQTSGYGTAGDLALVQRGTVTAKTADTFTVQLGTGVSVTFHVNSSTRFFGTSFAGLTTGQRVLVIGRDTGSSSTGFVARQVFR